MRARRRARKGATGTARWAASDTCTPARCTQRLLVAEVARQIEEKHADWPSLSEAEQEAAVRMHTQHCFNHTRNIFLKPMAAAQSAHVKEALKEQLEAFTWWERMETDFEHLLRAVYKVRLKPPARRRLSLLPGCLPAKSLPLESSQITRRAHL